MEGSLMTLLQRYRRLTPWNKLGVWGALASIIGLLLAFAGSPSISQQTHGNLSLAIANNRVSLVIASTPDALK